MIQAIGRVPREAFVPEESRHLAYENEPLPIGEGQTISQPFVVAMMVSALEVRRSDRVLEIGTGSGYQAAVLAELAREVVSVERLESLASRARDTLRGLGYTNIEVRVSAGGLGWPEGAPYDAIIVAAGAPRLPRELMDQLTERGRLVVPVGSLENQELVKVTRTPQGIATQTLGPCRFVPLIGEGAWKDDDVET